MSLARNQILVGDALDQLRQLPEASVDMVLTSPPYFRLRDYGTPGQLGLETHVQDWVQSLLRVSHELRRVLLPTGTFWLNIGDSYSAHPDQGAATKSLLLGPERLSIGLVQDGWLLRNKIVWQKSNPMPSSVGDRLSNSWEGLYLLSRQARYFFDLDAVRIPHTSKARSRTRPNVRRPRQREMWRGPNAGDACGLEAYKARGLTGHPLGKNPGDVWKLASSTYRGGHHATFPTALVEQVIRAGSPEARCSQCRAPWKRSLIRTTKRTAVRGALLPSCDCQTNPEPAVILDPFLGAGTTAVVAEQLGRDWLGIELNPDYAHQAEHRIQSARHTRTHQTKPPPEPDGLVAVMRPSTTKWSAPCSTRSPAQAPRR